MFLKIIVLLFVIGITWSLLYVKPNGKRILPLPILGNAFLDVELKYQIITLVLACLTLGLVFWVTPVSFQKYFSLFGNISAPPCLFLLSVWWIRTGYNLAFNLPSLFLASPSW